MHPYGQENTGQGDKCLYRLIQALEGSCIPLLIRHRLGDYFVTVARSYLSVYNWDRRLVTATLSADPDPLTPHPPEQTYHQHLFTRPS